MASSRCFGSAATKSSNSDLLDRNAGIGSPLKFLLSLIRERCSLFADG
jgi:hypothetical protein